MIKRWIFGSVAWAVILLISVSAHTQVLNDFDGDGTSDLLGYNTLDGFVSIGFVNNATLGTTHFITTIPPIVGWTLNATGDFNGDSKSDLLFGNTTQGEVPIMILDGETILTDGVVLELDFALGYASFGTGDFNADGIDEIVLFNASTGGVDLVTLSGTTFVSRDAVAGLPDLGAGWSLIGMCSFNDDDKSDFLWHNTTTGEVSYSEMDGSTQVSLVSIGTTPFTYWQVIDCADYNNDGFDDVLLFDAVSLQVGTWLQNSGTVSSQIVFGTIPADYEYINSGDHNGDGKADILVWNPVTGQTVIAVQDGTTVTSTDTVITLDTADSWTPHPGKP